MTAPLPRHVAIIMDGNGRWAQARGLPRVHGHEQGAESVRKVTRMARKIGIEVLTMYSFSTENWNRPRDEVAALMKLLHRYLKDERQEMLDKGIRLRAIGELERLPKFVRVALDAVMKITDRPGTQMTLNLALSYGSRAEMLGAVQQLAQRVQRGELSASAISEEIFAEHLHTSGLPDPDLLIRTSGELRLSNFMLWQLAYTEIYVTDIAWPDFGEREFRAALDAYGLRQRRYGKTGDQIQAGSA